MSPSMTPADPMLQAQQQAIYEQNFKQQYEQNLINQQQAMLDQSVQGQTLLEQQTQQQAMLDVNQQQIQHGNMYNQQLGISNQNQALQQQIIQQQQNIIAQQSAAIQQKNLEEQFTTQENLTGPQTNALIPGQTLDPSLQNLQNILAQIIQRPDSLQQSRKESESETGVQNVNQQLINQQINTSQPLPVDNNNVVENQQQHNMIQEHELLQQKMQNLISAQMQQQNAHNVAMCYPQQNQQQFMQPHMMTAVDHAILAQQQHVAQAQQQVAQAQQQLNMQRQMLTQHQLVLQQQMLTQQHFQMQGQSLSPQHLRNLQQQQYLAQQELHLQTQQNFIDQQNLALLTQKQQLMGRHQQNVEEILHAQRPPYQRQGSEQSQISSADVHDQMLPDHYQQQPNLMMQPQMSIDQGQYNQGYVDVQNQIPNQQPIHTEEQYQQMQQQMQPQHMQGQSLPHNVQMANFPNIQQNDRQVSSHEGTPVQNYTANPLQMYQQTQPQPVQTQMMQQSQVPTYQNVVEQQPQEMIPQQLNIPQEQAVENGFQANGAQKEQFLTPMTEFPTQVETIRPPELTSVEEQKQVETQQQEGK